MFFFDYIIYFIYYIFFPSYLPTCVYSLPYRTCSYVKRKKETIKIENIFNFHNKFNKRKADSPFLLLLLLHLHHLKPKSNTNRAIIQLLLQTLSSSSLFLRQSSLLFSLLSITITPLSLTPQSCYLKSTLSFSLSLQHKQTKHHSLCATRQHHVFNRSPSPFLTKTTLFFSSFSSSLSNYQILSHFKFSLSNTLSPNPTILKRFSSHHNSHPIF